MDDRDKNLIIRLRKAGKSYANISKATGIRKETIGAFCRANSIEPTHPIFQSGICPECGKAVEQPSRGRKRTFCSEACRRTWWHKNEIFSNRSEKKTHKVICICCGKEFIAHKSSRKFCSLNCYYQSRFGAVIDEQ